MRRRSLIGRLPFAAAFAAGLGRGASAQPAGADPKRQVVALLKSIETGDPGPAAVIDPDRYTQHNLAVADGLAGFRALVGQLPPGFARVDTVRVFRDGDHVFAHSRYDFSGPRAGFDIFRFADGRIVEHWDNLQDMPGQPNPSGRTMLDGATETTDAGSEDANKAVVRGFVGEVLGERRMDRVAAYVDPGSYIQHNPHVGDGAAAMVEAFRRLDAAGTPHRYTRTHKLLAEGDFVLAASEGVAGSMPTAFYDLFRLAGGRIVEHWDTLQTIPPRADWKNGNGKF